MVFNRGMTNQTPMGVRNNNPLNIRAGIPWEGLAYEANGFAVFQSPVFGFRAAFRSYITKYDRGLNTVRKLITEWAPPSENDTAAYIKTVCDRTGYGPDDVIALKTWDVAKNVCYAQTIVENGGFAPFTMDQMAEGAFRAGVVDAPAPFTHKVTTTIAAAGAGVAAASGGTASVIQQVGPSLPQGHHIQIICAVLALVLSVVAVFWNLHHHRESEP